jgi:hypothetical protein
MLLTMDEAFLGFKQQFRDVEIGFSSFCVHRPPEVIKIGKSGPISCTCEYHENFSLMYKVIQSFLPYLDLEDLKKHTMCPNSNLKCTMRTCFECKKYKNSILNVNLRFKHILSRLI